MLVVSGNCLAQASREFLGVYPNARLLVADETNSTEDKRHRIPSRAATANRDVITITHSAFRFIAVPSVFEAERSVATTGAAWPEPFATRQPRCGYRRVDRVLNLFLANRRFHDCPASPTVPLEATSRLKRVRYCPQNTYGQSWNDKRVRGCHNDGLRMAN